MGIRTIWVDADGCPVVGQSVHIGGKFGWQVVLICDVAHEMERKGATTIYVDQGADSADFALVNRVHAGDVIVTQDYGLAAMCLARGGRPIDPNGRWYTEENIESLLLSRHLAKKARRAGERAGGPSKRKAEQDKRFAESLARLLQAAGEAEERTPMLSADQTND